MRWFVSGLICLVLLCPSWARAGGEGFGDVAHLVFVPADSGGMVSVIETTRDEVIGSLSLGLAVRQIEISSALAKLVATDGQASSILVVDLVTGRQRALALSVRADRLLVSTDGLRVAVIDGQTGRISLVDLLMHREIAVIAGPAQVQDAMFSDDGRLLYLASATRRGVVLVDMESAGLVGEIGLAAPAGEGVAAFTRSPNGRRIYATPTGGGAISVLDAKGRQPLSFLAVSPSAGLATPSGTGAYVMVPENEPGLLAVFHGNGDVSRLAGSHGMSAVYSAWFDTVAFVADLQGLLIYDLSSLARVGKIELAGRPGRGSVTPDGQKLYLPVPDARQVVVIDAQKRRSIRTISLPARPAAAVMAASYGLCH